MTSKAQTSTASSAEKFLLDAVAKHDGLEFVPDPPDEANEKCRAGGLRATKAFDIGDVVLRESDPFLSYEIFDENSSRRMHHAKLSKAERAGLRVAQQLEADGVPSGFLYVGFLSLVLTKLKPTRRELLKAIFPASSPHDLSAGLRVCGPAFYSALSKHYKNSPGNPPLSADSITQLVEIARIHSHQCGNEESSSKRRALFACASLVQHSCSPNVAKRQEGRDMALRAVKQIQPGTLLTQFTFDQDDEHQDLVLQIPMGIVNMPTVLRRKWLSLRNFVCDCSACTADDLLRPLPCPQPQCEGFVLHNLTRQMSLPNNSGWKCSTCDHALPCESELLATEQLYFDSTLEEGQIPFGYKDLEGKSSEEVFAFIEAAEQSLGTNHWCFQEILRCAIELDEVRGIRGTQKKLRLLLRYTRWWITRFRRDPSSCAIYTSYNIPGLLLPMCVLLGGEGLQSWEMEHIEAMFGSLAHDFIKTAEELQELLSPFRDFRAEQLQGLERVLLKFCNLCGKKCSGVCNGCKKAGYCLGKDCQKLHWKLRHKHRCKAMQALKTDNY